MRQNRALWLAAVLIPLAAGGCVQTPLHYGSSVPAPASIHIEKNQTTEQDLVKQLGPPLSDTDGGDNLRVLTWTGASVSGVYNMGVTIPLYGASGNEQSEQTDQQTSIIATVRDQVVVDYTIVDRQNGENEQLLQR